MKRFWILYLVLAVAIVAAVFLLLPRRNDTVSPIVQGCTKEARQCPDGSSVGRVPPSCEFTACPEPTGITPDWIATTTAAGTFSYPQDLLATYTSTVDWPPVLQISSEPYSCTQAGSEVERAGKTEQRMVDDRAYCVTTMVEGAAGSTYTQYAYAWQRTSGTATLTFTVRQPQCLNYDDPQRTACLNEQQTFDLDSVVDRIAQTVRP
jgi:hypothetical protein